MLRKGNRVGNFLMNGQFYSISIAEFRRNSVGDPDDLPKYADVVSGNPPREAISSCRRMR